jgi:DNA-binding response OmpR family regulator
MSWVLVIEDEEDISSFLKYVLENEDYTVKTASSLAEARAHLKGGVPDAVLLDRGLPDGDGLEICRELKKKGVKPPILVLTARKNPDEVKEGLAAGADHYIVKPFEFMDVLSRLSPAQPS